MPQPSIPQLLTQLPGALARRAITGLTTKNNPVTKAIVMYIGGGRATWTTRDYTQLMREGFEQQATVYAAVMLMAKLYCSIPKVLMKRSMSPNGDPQEITKHDLLDVLNRPNNEQGAGAFNQAHFAYLKVTGNSYLAMNGPAKFDLGMGPPTELWILRPDRMKVIPDMQERIGGYVYAQGRGGERKFVRDSRGRLPVIHHKLFAATDDWYGYSPLAAAAKNIDLAAATLDSNAALMQNQMRPSGALVAKGTLDDPQFDRLKTELRENYQGAHNAGLPLILDGDLDWRQISLNPRDLDWLSGIKQSAREIARVFNLAPELLGDADGKTFANFETAMRAAYEHAVIPDAQMVIEDLNNTLLPRWDDSGRLYLALNLDAVPSLRESQDSLYTRTEAAHSLSLNEKRQALGFSPLEDFDVITLPNGIVLFLEAGKSGTLKVKETWMPSGLLPMDERLPELPEEDEEEETRTDENGKVVPLRAAQ